MSNDRIKEIARARRIAESQVKGQDPINLDPMGKFQISKMYPGYQIAEPLPGVDIVRAISNPMEEEIMQPMASQPIPASLDPSFQEGEKPFYDVASIIENYGSTPNEEPKQMLAKGEPDVGVEAKTGLLAATNDREALMEALRQKSRPADYDIIEQLKENLRRRDGRTKDYEKELEEAKNKELGFMDKMDLTNAFSLINSSFGTNYGQGYKGPTAEKDKQALIAQLQSKIAKNDEGLADDQLNYIKHLSDGQYRRDMMALQKQKLASGGGDNPFQKKKLEAFGKGMGEWFQTGRGQVDGNINKLNTAMNKLDEAINSNQPMFGAGRGNTPDIIRNFTNPEAMDVRDSVHSAVQDTLRSTLGAQFTEKEGERILRLAVNENLDDQTNRGRISRLRDMISLKKQKMDDLNEYISRNGTDVGFPHQKYDISGMLDDIEKAKGSTPMSGGDTKEWNGVTYKKVGDQWIPM